jgi:hypothetical protein
VLNLNDPRWSELAHAYGSAGDIPALLEQLRALPSSSGQSEPWFSLWGALAHQGDVYSASFAAVPHVVAALATAPAEADESYFQFPAWVEICRAKQAAAVPADLATAYSEALALLPGLVAQASAREWSAGFAACAMSAIAAAKGQHVLAEAVLELSSSEVAEEFLQWHFDR